MPPKVLIIGGGLGGLTLAQSLRSNNIQFKIFDRDLSATSRKQGHAVLLHRLVPALRTIAHEDAPPLESVGVSAGSGATEGFAVFEASGEAILRRGADTYPNWIRANRLRLREWLCTGIDVEWNKHFTRCERGEDGIITAFFTDGSTERGDILIGADGASSPVRNNIYQPNPPKATVVPLGIISGEVSLSPREYMHQRSLAQSFYLVRDPCFNLFVGLSNYTPSQSRHYWFLSWEDENAGKSDFWVKSAKPEEMLAFARDNTKGFDPKFRKILELQEPGEMVDPFLFKEVIPVFLSGEDAKAPWTVMGDAAHSMTPFQGQGANEAMQDALNISAKIVEASSGGEKSYAEALREYEDEMIPRAIKTIEESRKTWKTGAVGERWK